MPPSRKRAGDTGKELAVLIDEFLVELMLKAIKGIIGECASLQDRCLRQKSKHLICVIFPNSSDLVMILHRYSDDRTFEETVAWCC